MTFSLHRGRITELRAETGHVPNSTIMQRSGRDVARGELAEGVVSLLASTVGENNSNANSDPEMAVTIVSFILNDQAFFGMLASMPFGPGDELAVVAEWSEARQLNEIKAIARPADRLITLHPRCKRGRIAYFVRARRRWAVVSGLVALAAFAILARPGTADPGYGLAFGITIGFTTLYAFIERRIYVENDRIMVYLTEAILTTLGVAEPQKIDLVRISKMTRTASDPPGYRWKFYRY